MNAAILIDGVIWIVDGTTLRVVRRGGVTHHALRPLHVRTTLQLHIDADRRRPVAVVTVQDGDTTTTHLADIVLDRDTFRLVDSRDSYRQREIEFVPASDFQDHSSSELAWMVLKVLTGVSMRHHSLEYDSLMRHRLYIESHKNNLLRHVRLLIIDGRELLRTRRESFDHVSTYVRGRYYFAATDGSSYSSSGQPFPHESLLAYRRNHSNAMHCTTVAGRTYHLVHEKDLRHYVIHIREFDFAHIRTVLTAKMRSDAVVEGFTVSPSESVSLYITRTFRGVKTWGIRVLHPPSSERVPPLSDLCIRHVEKFNLDLSRLPIELIERVRGLS